MNLSEPLLVEIRVEGRTTHRMLERVPESSLDWRPHGRSRTLGEIASHIARLPGLFLATLDRDDLRLLDVPLPPVYGPTADES